MAAQVQQLRHYKEPLAEVPDCSVGAVASMKTHNKEVRGAEQASPAERPS